MHQSLRSSVVAFISLASQIIHGCAYVSGVLDSSRDANDDIRCLREEVSSSRSIVQEFRRVLEDLKTSGVPAAPSNMMNSMDSTLKSIEKARRSLAEFITRNELSGAKRSKFKFVLSRGICKKHISRLGENKKDITDKKMDILFQVPACDVDITIYSFDVDTSKSKIFKLCLCAATIV